MSTTSRARPWPELLFTVILLVLVAIRLVEQYRLFAAWPGSDWNSSEWLINYAAGFVRRGLGGQILMDILQHTGWRFFPLWAGFSLAVYVGLCGFVLWRCWRTRAKAAWRCILLLNPALLLFPAESAPYGSFMRKEVLFVAATAILVLLAEFVLRPVSEGRAKPAGSAALYLTTCVMLSTVLALIHEGLFLFCWLPLAFAITCHFLRKLQWSRPALAIALAGAFIPPVAAAAACVHWHGSTTSAVEICESWHPLGVATQCFAPGHFPPAVAALGWTTSYAASIPRHAAWRYPFFLLFYAAAIVVILAAIRKLYPWAKVAEMLPLLLLPFLASLPISAIGWDWGRYTFTVLGQQLLILTSDSLRPAVFALLPCGLQSRCTTLAETFMTPVIDSAGSAIEHHPLAAGTVLLLIPFPSVPPERTLYKASPPCIVADFVLYSRDSSSVTPPE